MTKKYIPLEVAITAMTADNLLAHFDSVEDVIEKRFHRAAERILASIPAADAVEVVRCGECVEWQSGWKPSGAKEGTHFCAVTGLCKEANWFCADGERKDGGQDDV